MTITVETKHLNFAVCIIFLTCLYPAMSQTLHESSVAKIHEQWMSQYGRSYPDDTEKENRLKIFKENLEFIENFNAQNKSYKMGLNQFADLTTEEFIASRTGFEIANQKPFSPKVEPVAWLNLSFIPASVDWRKRGAVTHVKNQRQCNVCWVFSSVGAIEGFIKIKTGYLIPLSEQQLVDCIQGCRGSYMDIAYNYVIKNHGIASETSYPYQGVAGTCKSNQMRLSGRINGFVKVARNSEEQLLQAVVKQPVAVAISANDNFRFYKEGIFTGPCQTNLNHAAVAIGYGTNERGIKYWLIKNSWTENWGEGGYMRLLRQSGQPQGLCGIAMDPSYPI